MGASVTDSCHGCRKVTQRDQDWNMAEVQKVMGSDARQWWCYTGVLLLLLSTCQ